MKKKEKITYLISSIVIVLVLVVGVTYAYWLITKQQTNENVITTGCLDLSIVEEANDIELLNAYPITDLEGSTLTPYTFSVQNHCDTDSSISISLEVLEETTLLNDDYLKVQFYEVGGEQSTDLFSAYTPTSSTVLDTSLEARTLYSGRLTGGEKKDFGLRLWLDYDTPTQDDAMEKVWKGKITLTGEVAGPMSETLCTKNPNSAVCTIAKLGDEDTKNLTYDGTKDNNLRYIGKNPNNYIDLGDSEDAYALKVEVPLTDIEEIGMPFIMASSTKDSCRNGLSGVKYMLSQYEDSGLSIIEGCFKKANDDKLYVVEATQEGFSVGYGFKTLDECQISLLSAQHAGAEIITSCTQPEEIYTFKVGKQQTYSDLASCQQDKDSISYENAIYEMDCALTPTNLWRIVGVMNNIRTKNGDLESRLKVVRADSIGEYSWREHANIQHWYDSDIDRMLNPCRYPNHFWEKDAGSCYSNGILTDCDFTKSGLSEKAKTYVALFGINFDYPESLTNMFQTSEGMLSTQFYEYEDDVSGDTGKELITLITPSDYGFATSGSETTLRSECLNTNLNSWNTKPDCYENDWLLPSTEMWLYSNLEESYGYRSIFLSTDGSLYLGATTENRALYPTATLYSDVVIQGGNGTISNPYTLEPSTHTGNFECIV